MALSISLWKTNNHYLFLWLFKVWQRLSSFQHYLFWFLHFCRIMVFYIQNFSARSWAYHKQTIILKGFVRDVETYFTIMILLEKFWIIQCFNLYWIWKLRIYRQIQKTLSVFEIYRLSIYFWYYWCRYMYIRISLSDACLKNIW